MRDRTTPAFPIPDGEAANHGHFGMTLRDWFAGQALAGICSCLEEVERPLWQNIAEDAYVAADAIMRERQK